jgi:hypothetical protein
MATFSEQEREEIEKREKDRSYRDELREVFNKIFYDELNVEEGIFDEESDYLMD